jgi:hypothetical protein
MESDLPFLRPSAERGTDPSTVRVDVGLDSASLTPGTYHGRLRLFTDDQEFPELFVPVQAAVIK